jgi:enediyne biosynthesis protein E4
MLVHGLVRRIIAASVLSLAAVVLLQGASTPSPIRFELSTIPFRLENDQTPAKNAPETMPGGVAVFDYNGDGRPDIFFTNGANISTLKKDSPKYRNRLFRNDGKGVFTDVTDAAGLAGSGTIWALRSQTTTMTAILICLSPACTTARSTTTTATARLPT